LTLLEKDIAACICLSGCTPFVTAVSPAFINMMSC